MWHLASYLTWLSLLPSMYNGKNILPTSFSFFSSADFLWSMPLLLHVKHTERGIFLLILIFWHTVAVGMEPGSYPQGALESSFLSEKDLDAGVYKVCYVDHWWVTVILQVLWNSGWESSRFPTRKKHREAPLSLGGTPGSTFRALGRSDFSSFQSPSKSYQEPTSSNPLLFSAPLLHQQHKMTRFGSPKHPVGFCCLFCTIRKNRGD